MFKTISIGTLALTFVLIAPGCLLVPTHRQARPGASQHDCPPGHRWSDGKCHSRGKGHDPAKHPGKGHP